MRLHILFCGDANVTKGIAMAALSVAEHTKRDLTFHILTAHPSGIEPISPAFAARLEEAARENNPGATVRLYDVTDAFLACPPTANMGTRFTPLCMLRLYADTLPELPDRLLYLDADVLCRKDPSDFYDTDMGEVEIIGVPDRYGQWFFGRIWRREYLNSGVLLMNLAAIRQSGLFERCRVLCRDKNMFLPDQAALNRLALKRKAPRRFNEQAAIRSDTVFKHFSTYFSFFPTIHAVTIKPWQPDAMHDVLHIHEFDPLLTRYERSFSDESRDPAVFRR